MAHENNAHNYDYVLAGGGGAGLSLALALIQRQELSDARILVVDRERKGINDRTWCFWATDPLPFAEIAHRSWNKLRFIGGGHDLDLELDPYRYQMLRSGDFYRHALDRLAAAGNVDVLQAEVDAIEDTGPYVTVRLRPAAGGPPPGGADVGRGGNSGGSPVSAGTDGSTGGPGAGAVERLTESRAVTADYVFDSTWDYGRFMVDETKYHNLKQHFLGRVIRAPYDVFDADRATMFDFRTPQEGVMRFVYTMPSSPREALIEFTLFSYELLSPQEYDRRVNDYIRDIVGLERWEVLEEESCIIPMTDYPFERRPSPRVLRTGTKGGRVKASTGYAFARMQRDSAAIAESLARHGHPFDLPRVPARYRLFDSILLQVLYRNGERAEEVFSALFSKNPVQRIFRFLDEDDGRGQNLKLMSTVPIGLFTKAAARVLSGKAP